MMVQTVSVAEACTSPVGAAAADTAANRFSILTVSDRAFRFQANSREELLQWLQQLDPRLVGAESGFVIRVSVPRQQLLRKMRFEASSLLGRELKASILSRLRDVMPELQDERQQAHYGLWLVQKQEWLDESKTVALDTMRGPEVEVRWRS